MGHRDTTWNERKKTGLKNLISKWQHTHKWVTEKNCVLKYSNFKCVRKFIIEKSGKLLS